LRYFARLPSRTAESGLLAPCTVHFLLLPSDPAVTSNALAIRIVFPLVEVTPAFHRLGLPAMPGKQKWVDDFKIINPFYLIPGGEITLLKAN